MRKIYRVSLWIKLVNLGTALILTPLVFLSFYLASSPKQYLIGSVMFIATSSITLFLIIRFIDLLNEKIVITDDKFIFFGYSYLWYGKNKKIEFNLSDIKEITLQRSIYSNENMRNRQFTSLVFKSKEDSIKALNLYNWSLLQVRNIVHEVSGYYPGIVYNENIDELTDIDPKKIEK